MKYVLDTNVGARLLDTNVGARLLDTNVGARLLDTNVGARLLDGMRVRLSAGGQLLVRIRAEFA